MRAELYALVHTHASKAGFLGRLAARRARVAAVLHTPHTFSFERRDTRLVGLYRWLERRAAGWCDRIVLVAPSQRETALSAGIGGPERLVVVENGIALPTADPRETRRRYRAELGLGESAPAVAFVGRLSPQKDVQAFLAAAEGLRREMPGVQLFLVGAADSRSYLRSLRPRISAEGWQLLARGEASPAPVSWSSSLPVRVLGHRADAANLVAAFDVVILPSLYEGLPYSLLEAMANGVPVVASAVTGNRDVIEHGRNGFLVPVGDVGGFVRSTLELLRDGARRRQVGAAARERVSSTFTEERFLRRMSDLYETMVGSARERPQT
jgi:glycosyltransferase involved in cell wall biosynthesis